MLGFKRRGMLVNHMAKRHPEIPFNAVPELNLPILKTTKDFYCQYCEKVGKRQQLKQILNFCLRFTSPAVSEKTTS